jgi:hypothetical protein
MSSSDKNPYGGGPGTGIALPPCCKPMIARAQELAGAAKGI